MTLQRGSPVSKLSEPIGSSPRPLDLTQGFQLFDDFSNMAIDFHFWPDRRNFSCFINQKCRTCDSHRFFAIQVFFDPDSIFFGNGVIFVCQKREGEFVLFDKFFVRFDGIGTDPQNNGFRRFKFPHFITESTGLLGTAWGVISRIKIKDNVLLSFKLTQFCATLGEGRQVK